ncbi:uncharacterized protein LOC115011843 [Cottoperca gobio]|uniref:Uncharacterized protein LOC115011843 n=1 Tax=Cottoperca gobio TaxID=56716 RepID=A0A6J2Q3A2_COTGO|nr:uncharacterized protein LOC115011843 [Cottoperca gobio]
MDHMELGDMGSGCEDENCGHASGFPEDCLNQECQWEDSMFGFTELVCVTVIYIPLMLFGLLGNILTILVVWLRPHMRSSTYLYLSSMAVSDLLILLLLPLDLYKLWRPRPWPLGELACKLTMFLSECCTFCTILHITFLSLERYLAVCWPITAKTLVTRRRTRALIGCLWLGAAVSAAPFLVMVGVEEVGGEELGLGGWTEDGGWTGKEGEQQGGFMIGLGERESGHMASIDGVLEGIKWGEKEKKGWGERDGELKRFGQKGEREVGKDKRNEREQEDRGKIKPEKQADKGGGEEEGEMEVEVARLNKMKEDEGGGREEGIDRGGRGEIDNRECRCTHYAVSSGLLSAMMVVSNLYFLVPLCILGLVYSLIGRTLWLRPQSSRRDQSHRHTVKMLGVIVLAFVLCWLPFHVGRTIFSISLGSSSDRQEAYMDTNSNLDINTLSDYLNLVSSVLFYLSAAINPLLYNLMSASHAGLVPDASLDASLASLLSLNSSWALEQQYSTLQSTMTWHQRFAFNRDLHTLFGGNTMVPVAANSQDKMTALLENSQRKLRSELMDFYGRMVSLERSALSSAGVKQWMNGAALHVHMVLHWKRLTDPSAGEFLNLDYLHRVDPLLDAYREYLVKTVQVFPAMSPGPSGLLTVEPLRNVSHVVQHRVCERKAIQHTLVERFLSDQNLQRGKEFFQSSHKHHDALIVQHRHFQLSGV